MLDTIIVPSRPSDSEICELTSDSYAMNETLDSVPFQVSRDKFFDKPSSIIVATMMSSLGKTRLSNADEAALPGTPKISVIQPPLLLLTSMFVPQNYDKQYCVLQMN